MSSLGTDGLTAHQARTTGWRHDVSRDRGQLMYPRHHFCLGCWEKGMQEKSGRNHQEEGPAGVGFPEALHHIPHLPCSSTAPKSCLNHWAESWDSSATCCSEPTIGYWSIPNKGIAAISHEHTHIPLRAPIAQLPPDFCFKIL